MCQILDFVVFLSYRKGSHQSEFPTTRDLIEGTSVRLSRQQGIHVSDFRFGHFTYKRDI